MAPRVWLGVVAYLLYLAVFYGVWIVNGIDYPRIGESEDTLLKWYVLPLAAGTVVIAIIVSVYGWWRPALVETRKRLPAWVWILPGITALLAIGNLLLGDISGKSATMWIYLIVGSLLVGFNEELVTRGQLIVALRSRFGELGVWFFSTLLFAALHLPNTLFGTGLFGLTQVLFTFLAGTTFYLLRRVSGSLVLAMLLHALWDFSAFATTTALVGFSPLIGVVAVIVAIILLRKESKTTHRQPAL
ncbi:lysostaphin resistance A-like protein [Microbacterium sp. GXF0217]